jgi:hypothetical protein
MLIFIFSIGVDGLTVEDGDHYLFWYKKLWVPQDAIYTTLHWQNIFFNHYLFQHKLLRYGHNCNGFVKKKVYDGNMTYINLVTYRLRIYMHHLYPAFQRFNWFHFLTGLNMFTYLHGSSILHIEVIFTCLHSVCFLEFGIKLQFVMKLQWLRMNQVGLLLSLFNNLCKLQKLYSIKWEMNYEWVGKDVRWRCDLSESDVPAFAWKDYEKPLSE